MSDQNGQESAVAVEEIEQVEQAEQAEEETQLEARDLAAGDFEAEPVEAEQPEGEPEASAEYTTQEPAADEVAADSPSPSPSSFAAPAASIESDDAHYINLIREAEYSCQRAESAYLMAKEQAKEAKEYFESKVSDLRRIVRQGASGLPLFDQGKQAQGQATAEEGDATLFAGDSPAAADTADASNESSPDDSWRTVSLIEAGVPIKIYDLLAEHSTPILTVGDLADFTSGEHNRLTSIKGIGAGKAEKIEAAMEKFWASRKAESVEEGSVTESAGEES